MVAKLPSASVLAAVIVSGLVLVACGSGNDETEQTADDLWGHAFRSTAVTEDSEPRPLVPETQITVTFEERADEGVVGWQAGCNSFGADVEITADSLVVGQIAGTEIGCRDDLHEQDDWLVDFFGSDPEWQLSDDRLSLTSHGTVIELEAKPHG
jgi:heat shock protein HslJ